MSNSVTTNSVLFITFLVLKLTGVIHWSWWWITAPLWGGAILAVAVLTCVGIYIFFALGSHNDIRSQSKRF